MRDPIDKIVPFEFERLEPQPRAERVIAFHARTGGVVVYYPAAVLYMRADGSLPWWFPILRAWWWVQRRFRK